MAEQNLFNNLLQNYSAAEIERLNRLPMFSYAAKHFLPAVVFKIPLGAGEQVIVRCGEDVITRHVSIIENLARELGVRPQTIERYVAARTRLRIKESNQIELLNYNRSGNVLLSEKDSAILQDSLNNNLGRLAQVPLKWQVVNGFDS